MSTDLERELIFNKIKKDPNIIKTIQSISELYSKELKFFPDYNGFFHIVKISILDNKIENLAERLEAAKSSKISYEMLSALYENGKLSDCLFNLVIKQLTEKPSETALKFMDILNKKQKKS